MVWKFEFDDGFMSGYSVNFDMNYYTLPGTRKDQPFTMEVNEGRFFPDGAFTTTINITWDGDRIDEIKEFNLPWQTGSMIDQMKEVISKEMLRQFVSKLD